MGDRSGAPAWAAQVVKVLTIDGGETVLEPDFLDVCSEVKKKLEGTGQCGEVSVRVPEVCLGGLKGAIKYWEESKAETFDSAAYLGAVVGDNSNEFVQLVKAAKRLGYDLLFEEWVKEFRRRVRLMSEDPEYNQRDKGDHSKILSEMSY